MPFENQVILKLGIAMRAKAKIRQRFGLMVHA
jgi:hypothetical protein